MTGFPDIDELLESARVVAIPTRTRFRGITVREAVVFEGPNGATEFSPFTEYADDEAATWLAAAIDFGWGELPDQLREIIEVNATVPAVPPSAVAEVLAAFPGCTTAKVKVAERGGSLEQDRARVAEVRRVLGDSGRVRVDANGGWSVDEAARALEALDEFELDYAEQPCARVSELARLRRLVPGIRIAADESVRRADDPVAVAREGAADLLIVKAQPLGGVNRALDLVAEAGLPVVVSSALDTSVGIAMGLRLAASLPDHMLAGACGLGTAALLAGDVTSTPLLPHEGRIRVERPRLDPELLMQLAASEERTAWWRQRMIRCYGLLTA